MKSLKEHTAFKVLTLLLVASLFAPAVMKFVHVFEHDEHIVCTGEESTHIHIVDLDCEFNEFNLNKNTAFYSFNIDLLSEREFHSEINSQYIFLSKYQQLHFSLRGPPQLI